MMIGGTYEAYLLIVGKSAGSSTVTFTFLKGIAYAAGLSFLLLLLLIFLLWGT
jgi:hypothetical protein